jgi:hypothetical protein
MGRSAALIPDKAFVTELSLKVHTVWSLNVEEDEDARDIEEKCSHSEVFSRTDPVSETAHRARLKKEIGTHTQSSHLLPDPNILSSGSFTEGSSFPSLRNRSGSYV